jgi:hypothetical protein
VVAPLARALPTMVSVQLELGLSLAELGRTAEAARRVPAGRRPGAARRRSLAGPGRTLDLLGDTAGAESALAQQLRASTRDPALVEAAAALVDNRLGEAEQLLRATWPTIPPTSPPCACWPRPARGWAATRTPNAC